MTAVPVDLHMSYSQATKHRKCPQAWFYRYVMKIDKKSEVASPERDFGIWWHALLAADSITRGREKDSLKYVPETLSTPDAYPDLPTKDITRNDVVKAAKKAWKSSTPEYKQAFIEKMGKPLHEHLAYTFRQWSSEWAREQKTEEPLGVEMRWERRLPIDGVEVVLVGVIDEVYWDRRRKMIVVRDHKSHKELAASTSLDDMMDSQVQLYAWGVSPIVEEWGLGKVRATAYDRVKSVAPKSPQLTAGGALSKAVTAFDALTYETWVGEGIEWGEPDTFVQSGPNKGKPKFGVYTVEDKVLSLLNSPVERSKWFQRTLVPLNKTVIAGHLEAAQDTALLMIESKARAEASGSCARNLSKDCGWCPYLDLCRDHLYGGPKAEVMLDEYDLARL